MRQGWEKKRLDDLCHIELGKTPYRGDKSFWDTEKETDNVWLSIADMLNTDGDVVSDSKEYITDKAVKVSKIVKKGTLLLSFKLTLGRLAFAGKDLFTNEAIAALTIKNEKEIDKYFLYQFLSLFDWDAASEGDVKVKGKTLNKVKLKEIEIHFPKSLLEQQRIVAILDAAGAAIAKAKANAEQNFKNAKELFESYLQGVFENKGEGWEEKRFEDLCNLITCGVAATPKYVDESEGIPFLSAQNVRDGEVVLDKYRFISKQFHEELTKKNKPKKGDVLYSRVGSKFGEAGVVEHDFEFSVYVSLTLIKPKTDKLNNYYLKYYLNSPVIKELAKKSISSSGVPNLNVKEVREFPIKCPSISTQKKIVNEIETVSAETKKLEAIYQQKINDLEELKKSILQKAFSGELKTATALV
jgi:type I restriction enzyme S subunit